MSEFSYLLFYFKTIIVCVIAVIIYDLTECHRYVHIVGFNYMACPE